MPKKRPAEKATKKVAIYTRVSTAMQADKDSLPTQRTELVYYAQYVLDITDYEIFEDAGFSAKDTSRPAFQDMLARVRDGEFTHVLVWKIDRFSRSLIDFCNLYNELKDLGVTLVSKNERFDSSTAIGEAVLRIILVFAELERKLTAERVAAVAAHRSAEGKYNGGTLPLGYKYDKEAKAINTVPESADCVKEIFDKFIELKNYSHVAKYFNSKYADNELVPTFTASAIFTIIQNPYYIGIKRYLADGEYHFSQSTDGHELFIDEAIWKEANEIATDIFEARAPKHTIPNQYLGKILYCHECGKRLTIYPKIKKDKPYIYYTCNYRSCPMHNKSISENRIVPVLLQVLLNLIYAQNSLKLHTPLETFRKRITEGKLLEGYEADLESTEKIYNLLKAGKIEDAYYDPPDNITAKKLANIERQINRHEAQIKILMQTYDITDPDQLEHYKRAAAVVEANISTLNEQKKVLEKERSKEYKYAFTVDRLYSLRTTLHAVNIREYFPPADLAEFFKATVSKIYVLPTAIYSVVLKNGLEVKFTQKNG